MPGACQVDSLQFLCGSDIYYYGLFRNLRILAGHTSRPVLDSGFEENYAGNEPETAFAADSVSLRWQNLRWDGLAFTRPFAYNGSDNLILEVRWQGDDGNSVYDLGWYTPGNRAVDARSATAPRGTPRNYMPRLRIFYTRTGIDGDPGAAPDPGFCAAFPNPFRHRVSLHVGAHRVEILDVLGRPVRILDGPDPVWDGRDDRGRRVMPGVYLARVETPGRRRLMRLIRG